MNCFEYQSFDDANPFPRECPPADYSENSVDRPEDPRLYDDMGSNAGMPSAIQQEAARVHSVASPSAARARGWRGPQTGRRSLAGSGRGGSRAGYVLQPGSMGPGAGVMDVEEEEEEDATFQATDQLSDGAGELPVVKV